MLVKFIKDYANKKAGTVVEMSSFVFATLRREGYVIPYSPDPLVSATETLTIKEVKKAPIVIKKTNKPVKKKK